MYKNSAYKISNLLMYSVFKQYAAQNTTNKSSTYPEIVPLSALIACNAMN